LKKGNKKSEKVVAKKEKYPLNGSASSFGTHRGCSYQRPTPKAE
jgi:hypothetical protein